MPSAFFAPPFVASFHPFMKTAVLFIGFKRFEQSKAVFNAIRAAQPERLYFACDGARPDEPEEAQAVARVRSLVDMIDWPCELRTRFSDTNQNVKYGPHAAMDWFFAHEEEGIVLEDDCLPSPAWFRFASDLLERFRNDDRVWVIQGNNVMAEWESRNNDSYYFSAHGYGAYWGWASWRRVWSKYDLHMTDWPSVRDSGLLDGHFLSNSERNEAHYIFENTWNGSICTWDYQVDFGRWFHGMVNIIPAVNLVRNIGFGEDSTHTGNITDPRNQPNLAELEFPLVHPKHMLVDNRRDLAYFEKYIEPGLLRWFKSLVKQSLPKEVDDAITPFLGNLQRKLGL